MACTLQRVVNEFLEWCEVTLARNTVAAYRHQLRKFCAATGRKRVDALRPKDLSRWAKSWHEAQAVIRCFNWARDEAKIVRTNPFAICKLPFRGQRRRINTPEEIARLLRTAAGPGRRFLIALRETLARPQEIRTLAWEDLQSEDMAADLDAALVAGRCVAVSWSFKDQAKRKDSARPRVLLISPRLGRLILRIAKSTRERKGPIFLNSRGKPWTKNAVRCLMRRLRRRLGWGRDKHGENVVAYTFRHSLATLLASRGVNDRTLADLLGHVETRTTSRYLHLQVSHLREAYRRYLGRRAKS